jgi:hypothetical protein
MDSLIVPDERPLMQRSVGGGLVAWKEPFGLSTNAIRIWHPAAAPTALRSQMIEFAMGSEMTVVAAGPVIVPSSREVEKPWLAASGPAQSIPGILGRRRLQAYGTSNDAWEGYVLGQEMTAPGQYDFCRTPMGLLIDDTQIVFEIDANEYGPWWSNLRRWIGVDRTVLPDDDGSGILRVRLRNPV